MGRRRKKKNNSRKIWFVLILLCAVSLLGWKIWTSDEVQMRFVYMWPYQGEILEYSGKNKIDPFLVAAVIKMKVILIVKLSLRLGRSDLCRSCRILANGLPSKWGSKILTLRIYIAQMPISA